MTTQEWMLKIAFAVENWQTTVLKDDVAVAMAIETPSHVVQHSLTTIPAEQRAAVRAALPPVTSNDFALEARRIREAAERL